MDYTPQNRRVLWRSLVEVSIKLKSEGYRAGMVDVTDAITPCLLSRVTNVSPGSHCLLQHFNSISLLIVKFNLRLFSAIILSSCLQFIRLKDNRHNELYIHQCFWQPYPKENLARYRVRCLGIDESPIETARSRGGHK